MYALIQELATTTAILDYHAESRTAISSRHGPFFQESQTSKTRENKLPYPKT